MLYDIENVVANKGHCSFTLKGEEQRGGEVQVQGGPIRWYWPWPRKDICIYILILNNNAMCCTLHCQLLSEIFKMTDINDKHFICLKYFTRLCDKISLYNNKEKTNTYVWTSGVNC